MDDLKESVKESIDDLKERVEEDVEDIKDIIMSSKTRNYIRTKKHDTKTAAPSLGIIRLDYDYPAACGDIDCPESFPYDVYYKVVPGLTFELCQSGSLSEDIEERLKESIQWLVEEKNVKGISGDCGFMMYFQKIAREITHIPVFMSALCQLPSVTCAFGANEQIIILTANRCALEPMLDLIKDECGVDTHEERYHIIGCEDVEGFEAVAFGEKVDTKKVEPGIIMKALEALEEYPESRAFLLECTELPPYADAIRLKTGLPVFDAITGCNFFMGGFHDDVRFGHQNWQDKWDGKQEKYDFGDNLTEDEKNELVNKPEPINIEIIENIEEISET